MKYSTNDLRDAKTDDMADNFSNIKLASNEQGSVANGVVDILSNLDDTNIADAESCSEKAASDETLENVEENSVAGCSPPSSNGGESTSLRDATREQLISLALGKMKQQLIGSTMGFCQSVGLVKSEFMQHASPYSQAARHVQQEASSHLHNRLLSFDSGYASNHAFTDGVQPIQNTAHNPNVDLQLNDTNPGWGSFGCGYRSASRLRNL